MNATVIDIPAQREEPASVETVPIVALKPGVSPRLAGENRAHVRMLADLEIDLPPILVHRSSMRIVDGMHRLRAAELRGKNTIAVRFLDCDEKEIFATAVKANIKHGMPLSLADREAAARQILLTNPQWSDRLVASITGLSNKTVGTLRGRAAGEGPELCGRIGRDGRVRPVSTVPGRRIAADLMRQDPAKSLREVAKAAGVSVGTVRDVRQRLERGLEPAPEEQQAIAGQPGQAAPGTRREEHAPGTTPGAPETEQKNGRVRSVFAAKQPESAIDTKAIIESLSKDPSLRFCETGRLVIRLLHTCMVCATRLQSLADKVPPHRAATIAQLATAYADFWSDLARQLEEPPLPRQPARS